MWAMIKKTWVFTLITHVLKRKFSIFNIAGGQFGKPPIFTKGNPHLGNLYMTQMYIPLMKSGILFSSEGVPISNNTTCGVIGKSYIKKNFLIFFFFFFFFFSTGLVLVRLPLRSCRTIGAPSVQGSAQCAFFSFLVAAGFEPMYFSLGGGHIFEFLPPAVLRCTIICNIFLFLYFSNV